MKSVALNAAVRTGTRRGPAKRLRSEGKTPAVIYGRQTQPQALEVNTKELENILHHSASENVLLDLTVQGDQRAQRLALLQEVQHHPLSRTILHIDFHEVAPDEKVTITIPVESTGEPVGVKVGGGVLEHVLFKVKVRALPKDLPEVLIVDVTNLEVGKAVHIGEIIAPEGVEVLGNPSRVVLACAAPKTEEAASETPAGAAAAEPEVIKEKKPDAAAAPAAGADKKAEKKK